MERIARALELAYAQRIAAAETRLPAPAVETSPAEPGVVDFTDTVIHRTPAIELDAERRANERILPANAEGSNGAAYKMLRTQVLRRLDQLGATTLGVMSARAGAGKTLTAINLAIAIAADTARTVMLVDLDLRNPQIHRRFGHEPVLGVQECIDLHRPLRECMFKVSGYERITIAASRAACGHSSELLASRRMGEVVEEMRTRYANRIVIFDVPPVLEADDALAFSRHLQAGLMVVGEGTTQRQDMVRSLELLRDLTFVGTVLNASRDKAAYC